MFTVLNQRQLSEEHVVAKNLQRVTVINIFLFALVSVAQAELYVFPAKGQSQQQTEKDKFSCYGWAKNQTGFDPMNPPQVQAAAPRSGPGVLGGAARGAARGAIIGAIAGDAGKGAAIGAAAGGITRGFRNRNQRNKQQSQQQQQASQINRMRSDYDRAYSVCLEGKGYTVR